MEWISFVSFYFYVLKYNLIVQNTELCHCICCNPTCKVTRRYVKYCSQLIYSELILALNAQRFTQPSLSLVVPRNKTNRKMKEYSALLPCVQTEMNFGETHGYHLQNNSRITNIIGLVHILFFTPLKLIGVL